MKTANENNKVTFSGVVSREPEFSHESFGENFYIFLIKNKRLSGTVDEIPVLISERTYPLSDIEVGKKFIVDGEYRSFNRIDGEKRYLILNIFCISIRELSDCEANEDDRNRIELSGYFCKQPKFRETPLGRDITDLLIAVNRPCGKSDYIPCIAWGRNSMYLATKNVGDKISIVGRIQSREYRKRINESETETRVAYEVSITTFKEESDEQNTKSAG